MFVRLIVVAVAAAMLFVRPLPRVEAAEAAPAPDVSKTHLQIDGARFTINGTPTFLHGFSYYGALGAEQKAIIQDLDDMQTLGVNWIRVWGTWSAFDNDVSAVDNQGQVREPYMKKLKWLIAECDRRGMVVDVTLTKGEGRLGNAHVSALDNHARALETLTTQLKPWRNWYLDMANEHNIRSKSLATKFVSFQDARVLRDRVKKVDPQRLVTISYVRDASKADVRAYLLDVRVDFLSPHRPRNRNSAGQTAKMTRQCLTWMREIGQIVPIHYQEPFRRDFSKGWQPTAEDFATDLAGAIEGGAAGWCFHNGDNRWGSDAQPRRSFDMRSQRLFEQLDAVELRALKNLAAVIKAFATVAEGSPDAEPPAFQAWYVDSLKQVLVTDLAPASVPSGRMDAARGEVEAIQVAVRSRTACSVTLEVESFSPDMPVRVRTVGRVPIRQGTHRTPPEERVALPPVELPDPLLPGRVLELEVGKTECFWLDVAVPAAAQPGELRARISITADGGSVKKTLPLLLRVHSATVPFECSLPLTNWFSARPKELGFGDAAPGSEAWLASVDLLFDSMWAHRQNMFWTPLRPPWIKPLATESGELEFDFTLFDAWVEAFSRPRGGARKTYIEGQPIAWRQGYDGHVKARIWRLANGQPQEAILEANDPAAREGYRIFLSALKAHLEEKGWIDRFRIHITDEPHGHQLDPYRIISDYVREFAPEFRIMEALDVRDDFAFFEKHCDVWVPQLGRFDKSLDRMMERLSAGEEVWFYTCLFPNGAYPNRFVDYPLLKTRVLHWINFKWGFTGYLHWGFNQWRGGDAFKNLEPPHGNSVLPPGDAWIVYPGDRQLLDSMRYEAMRDGVEDFELLTLLAKKDRAKADEIASSIVRTFTDYERDERAFRMQRLKLLEALD